VSPDTKHDSGGTRVTDPEHPRVLTTYIMSKRTKRMCIFATSQSLNDNYW